MGQAVRRHLGGGAPRGATSVALAVPLSASVFIGRWQADDQLGDGGQLIKKRSNTPADVRPVRARRGGRLPARRASSRTLSVGTASAETARGLRVRFSQVTRAQPRPSHSCLYTRAGQYIDREGSADRSCRIQTLLNFKGYMPLPISAMHRMK